jgi:hypothetical protein
MREVTIPVYPFDELSPKAKDKARDWFREGVYSDNWWRDTYEDAEQIGLKITGFDLDRNRSISGDFTDGAASCANRVLSEHGEACASHAAAQAFIKSFGSLHEPGDDDFRADEFDAIEGDFLAAMLEYYSQLLQAESEYISTDEYADEGIEANSYEFTADGRVYP